MKGLTAKSISRCWKKAPLAFLLILAFSHLAWAQVAGVPDPTVQALSPQIAAKLDSLQQRLAVEGGSFTVGYNPAMAVPIEKLCGLVEPDNWRETAPMVQTFQITAPSPLPSSLDWSESTLNQLGVNGSTPVKDQGQCGACWAFATVAPLESQIKIQCGEERDLSEQYLVSCNRGDPSNGYVSSWNCDGGWFAHDYHSIEYYFSEPGPGSVFEASFPYVASYRPCGGAHFHTYRIDGWAYINPQVSVPSVQEIKQAIYDHGPVAAGICVGSSFQGYTGGIFNFNEAASCPKSSGGTGVNHAITLVGWVDDVPGDGYWILKNSWGPYWGEGGYMRIRYGHSNVGYAANFVEFSNCNVPVPQASQVSIAATIPAAYEQGRVKGGFTVTRSGDLSSSLVVHYSVGGTATNGRDYMRLGGLVTIPAGSPSAVIWVTPIDDRIYEGDETVQVTLLGNPSYIVGAPNSATVSLIDNEPPPPVVNITANRDASEAAGNPPGQFIVSSNVAVSRPLYVRYAVSGTAKNGIDYVRLSGRATIPAGQTSVAINITPREDLLIEGPETVIVTLLSSPGYILDALEAAKSATVTIADNDL